MLDRDVLFLLVALLYAFDSFATTRRGAVAFAGWRRGRWARRTGFDMTFGEARQVVLGSLLPPLNPVACVHGSTLDVDEASRRLALLHRHGRSVRIFSNLLFAITFAGLPIAILIFDAARVTWTVAGAVIAVWLITITAVVRARRRLAPVAPQPGLLSVVLSPLSTMRGQDTLANRLFEDLHPLAVAMIACDDATVGALARTYYYSPETGDIDRTIERFLKSHKLLDLVKDAPAQDFGAAAYCPRCWSQYVDSGATCGDCHGRALVRFQATS